MLASERSLPPNRPAAQQIAHYDPIGVTLADRNLVNANHPRCGRAGTLELGLHVLLVERLDRVPVQLQFRCHILDRRRPAAPADIIGKALGVEWIVGQKVEALPLHRAATAALDPPHLQFQKYPRIPARQIADPADFAVVPTHLHATAAPARRFFERRFSVIRRAFGSPKMPRTVGSGRKPGNEYVSQSRRRRFDARAIHQSCSNSKSRKMQNPLAIPRFLEFSTQKLPTRFYEDPLSIAAFLSDLLPMNCSPGSVSEVVRNCGINSGVNSTSSRS